MYAAEYKTCTLQFQRRLVDDMFFLKFCIEKSTWYIIGQAKRFAFVLKTAWTQTPLMADQDNDLKKFNHKDKTLRWWLSWFVNIYIWLTFFMGLSSWPYFTSAKKIQSTLLVHSCFWVFFAVHTPIWTWFILYQLVRIIFMTLRGQLIRYHYWRNNSKLVT